MKIRKLNRKTKMLFIVFTFFVLIMIGIFVFVLIKGMTKSNDEFKISKLSVVYDENNGLINLNNDGSIKKNWSNKYVLTLGNNKYNLGSDSVIFDPTINSVKLYGEAYKIYQDGKVETVSGETIIPRSSTASFYKLADRKYLIIDSMIKDGSGSFTTSNYIVINIDKQGNTLLTNNELSVKTINPIIIQGTNYNFDVAEEKLVFKDETIDLKKVNGSTNEYIKPVESVYDKRLDALKQDLATTYSTAINNKSNTNNTQNITVNTGEKIDTQEIVFYKNIGIRNIVANVNYLSVEYTVSDPGNEYVSVFLIVNNGNEVINRIQIDKGNTNYKITNLNSNTEYSVSIGYTYNVLDDPNKKTADKIVDEFVIRTIKPNYLLNITKINANSIEYNIKFDKNYVLSSGQICIYTNDVNTNNFHSLNTCQNIDVISAGTSNGFSSSIDKTNIVLGDQLLLKLDNAKYNDQDINLDLSTKVILK